MKTRYILFTVASLAISACARNNEPSEPEGMQMTFTAYQEGSQMTRTAVQDGGTQVYWEPADEIKVFFNGSSGRFVSQNSENATVATFTGTLNVIVGATEGVGYSTLTWGLYPYRADAVLEGDAMVTTLPASQTGRAGSFAKNTNISVAQSNGYGLAFYNVCGGLRFSLTQEGIKRVTFEGNNGEAIAGKIKGAFADGIPVVQEVFEGESVITLTAPNGGTFQTGQWYYISAIPGSLPGGYKMVFYKESESAKLTSSSSVTFKRGIFGSLADADEDLIFKPTGDEPNPNDFIQFEDPIAKFACIEMFDSNGDGEVSYAEATSVTSLSGLFANWSTVTSFEEIKYFTSVTSTVGVFDGLTKLKKATIPDFIIKVGSFQGCSSLETVTLPATIKSLPVNCFDGCTSLSSIALPTDLKSLPKNCFSGCSSLSSITLPTGLKAIPDNCFAQCSELSFIEIPSSVTSIGNYAFSNCIKLSDIDFPSGLGSIGIDAFACCSSITSIILPPSLTSLGERAFNWCTSLSSVKLPATLTTIPNGCFLCCEKLSSISWPQALTTIGDSAFAGCKFEKNECTLELPSTITSIGKESFIGIHHLILPSTSFISITSRTFIKGYSFLYVPANMVEMYKARTYWSDLADWIRPINDYPAKHVVRGTKADAVDLGLSVKWASWNVGASAPEDFGDYFAWGETDPKWDYDWATYKWCRGSRENTLSKYNTNSTYGTVDNKTVLEMEDDAARVNWGGSWRVPTVDEIYELFTNCDSMWATENGVNGYVFTSKKPGFTDKKIFLPAADNRSGYNLNKTGSGCYWASRISAEPYEASYFYFSGSIGFDTNNRCKGLSIRPVCD